MNQPVHTAHHRYATCRFEPYPRVYSLLYIKDYTFITKMEKNEGENYVKLTTKTLLASEK